MSVVRLHDKGAAVRQLQALLNDHGFNLVADGHFGAKTLEAVRAYQQQQSLVVDGIVGAKTWAALEAPAKRLTLTDDDFRQAAEELGVAIASIKALVEVESKGGFQPDGRPKILFERHIMHRYLGRAGIDPAPYVQSHPNIVNPATGGYFGGVREYERLEQAKAIHPEVALLSASWGTFQIMGFRYDRAGFRNVFDFVEAMYQGVDAHLKALVAFIQYDKDLHRAMVAKDWTEFSRIYNGPSFANHDYHIRIERAYQRLS